MFTQFAVDAPPYMQCVAISTTADARGPYYRYAFNFNTNFNDYAKLGVWPDAYYFSVAMFPSGLSPDLTAIPTKTGPAACALDRTRMLTGATARAMQCFQPQPETGLFLPADLDGATLPPTGAPNYFVGLLKNSQGVTNLNYLALWKYHVDWTTPSNSRFTGPTALKVATFNPVICSDDNCIPQLGTTDKLDSLSDRLMYRLAYRNFGTYQAMVVNHTVKIGTFVAAPRWYEIRLNNLGQAAVYQQGSYTQNDGNSRWMGSIAMDKRGNMALGYSTSGPNLYPSIRYTGRLATDPLNTMRTEKVVVAGGGHQTPPDNYPSNRWGDYSSMAIDPVDSCTFWYIALPTNH